MWSIKFLYIEINMIHLGYLGYNKIKTNQLFRNHPAILNDRRKHDHRTSLPKVLQFPNKFIQFHRTRKSNLQQHRIISSYTITFQYIWVCSKKRINFGFLCRADLKTDICFNMITELDRVNRSMKSSQNSFRFQSFNSGRNSRRGEKYFRCSS